MLRTFLPSPRCSWRLATPVPRPRQHQPLVQPTVSLSTAGYFVGPTGLTLYTFDKDTLGHSSCNGECAEQLAAARP